jgi:hypothetical protein
MPERRRRMLVLGGALALREPFWAPFFAELQKRGWREGVDYSLEAREYRGDPRRALAVAQERVALPVNARAAKAAGIAIPPPMLARADRVIE